ncbi:MAG: hypothetical protein HFJ09_08505 [Lachnospiraceae bacterium]|nr:hypothetical protein [Lachnospiraceae bacterium]
MSENKILKELDEKIQENIKRYIKDSETHIRLAGTEERIQACKEYVLGLTEIYEKYSQMPAYCDCASSSLKYLSEKENIEKAKEEAEQKMGCYDGVAFACYEIMVDVIIDLLKKV